jgi:hypothetical protein
MIRLPAPHSGQLKVLREMRRINILSAGRRWRKTTMAVAIGARGAMGEQGVSAQKIVWGAPTFNQVNIAWEELQHGMGKAVEFNRTRMTADFPSGGRITFRSLDNPDNARGLTADYIIVDEAGDVDQVAWYEVLRPMLMDTKGKALLIGTPKGRNWFWREWASAQDRADHMAWQIPSLGCKIENGVLIRVPHPYENPCIDFTEIKHMFETMPESTFRQEVLAEFLENEGAVFRNIDACMHAPKTEPAQHLAHDVVAGIDIAKQADWTVVSVFCATCGYELELERFNKIDYPYQLERIRAILEKWNVGRAMIDETGVGSPIVDQLRRDLGQTDLIGLIFTNRSKQELIENLSLGFEKEEAQWLNIPVATLELEAYERSVTVTGRSQYSAPVGLNDDTVIARALAFRAAFNRAQYSKPGTVRYV